MCSAAFFFQSQAHRREQFCSFYSLRLIGGVFIFRPVPSSLSFFSILLLDMLITPDPVIYTLEINILDFITYFDCVSYNFFLLFLFDATEYKRNETRINIFHNCRQDDSIFWNYILFEKILFISLNIIYL